jgi:hypothetical protein
MWNARSRRIGMAVLILILALVVDFDATNWRLVCALTSSIVSLALLLLLEEAVGLLFGNHKKRRSEPVAQRLRLWLSSNNGARWASMGTSEDRTRLEEQMARIKDQPNNEGVLMVILPVGEEPQRGEVEPI